MWLATGYITPKNNYGSISSSNNKVADLAVITQDYQLILASWAISLLAHCWLPAKELLYYFRLLYFSIAILVELGFSVYSQYSSSSSWQELKRMLHVEDQQQLVFSLNTEQNYYGSVCAFYWFVNSVKPGE